MNDLLALILTAILLFVVTNLDDLFVLMVFFSPQFPNMPVYSILIGRYLGFTLIILASLPGFFGSLFIAQEWLGLLGIIPLIMGIKYFFSAAEDEKDGVLIPSFSKDQKLSRLRQILPFPWLNATSLYVASVTLGNGGDNISVYLSLFAQENLVNLSIILIVFYLLLGIWCLLAYQFIRHPLIAKLFLKYGNIITPCVLIILGISIIIDSGIIQLIFA